MDNTSGKQTPTPVLEYSTPPSHKLWSVGTLTYTTGGLVVLFCWLLWGDFAWAMKDRAVMPVVQLMLKSKSLNASDWLMALLLSSLPALIGIVLGPIISYKSDRHRGRWGRRIPYLIVTTPIAAITMIGLSLSPELGKWLHDWLGASSPGLSESNLIFFGLFWVIFEFATIAAKGLFDALINDVVPRPLLGRFFGLFRALSLIAGMIFNFWLLKKGESHYVLLFIGIGTLYGIGFLMMCFKVKEGEYPPPTEPAASQAADQRAAATHPIVRMLPSAVRFYFSECFSNRYYLWVFLAFAITTITFLPVNLFSVPYAKQLNMDMDLYGKYLALTYLISLGLSYFLGALADRFHPLRVGIVSMALYAVVTLWGGIYATSVTPMAIALVAHGVLSGTFFTTTASLGQRLFPHARFAQFASAGAAFTAIATMLISPVMGRFLDSTQHEYRYTYWMGFGLAVLSLAIMLIVHRYFVALGGTKNYAAPE